MLILASKPEHMKKLYALLACAIALSGLQAQTTVVIKLGPNGKDSEVSDYSSNVNQNYGDVAVFASYIWQNTPNSTIYSEKGLVQFDLSQIPANATITSALLDLYADNPTTTFVGNPSTPMSGGEVTDPRKPRTSRRSSLPGFSRRDPSASLIRPSPSLSRPPGPSALINIKPAGGVGGTGGVGACCIRAAERAISLCLSMAWVRCVRGSACAPPRGWACADSAIDGRWPDGTPACVQAVPSTNPASAAIRSAW